jgi:hypothetical protein
MTKSPWEDIFRVLHSKTPTKTWDSFVECIMFHLQHVFRDDADEALKDYITNTLRNPNWIPIRQFLVRVEQLNSRGARQVPLSREITLRHKEIKIMRLTLICIMENNTLFRRTGIPHLSN